MIDKSNDPEFINDQIKKLSILSVEEQIEGDIAFVNLVNERQRRIENVKMKLMAKFGLTQEQLEKMPREQLAKLRKEITE